MALNFTAERKSGWQPGQSGNPSGKPRQRTLVDLCKANTEEAVKTLVVAMRFKGPQQVPAAIALLDRGWGKPKQVIEAEGGAVTNISLHLIAAQLISAQLIEQQQQPPTIVSTSSEQPQSNNLLDAPVPTE